MKPSKTYRAIRLARLVMPVGRSPVPADRVNDSAATLARSQQDVIRLRLPIAAIQEALQRKKATERGAPLEPPLASSPQPLILFDIPIARIQEALLGKNASARSAVNEAMQDNKSAASSVKRATRARPIDFHIPLARVVLPIDLKPKPRPRSRS